MTWRAIQDTVAYSMSLAELSHGAERLYWRMLAYSDPWGRLPGTPRKIHALCVPLLEVTMGEIEQWINELVAVKRVRIHSTRMGLVAELLDFETNQPGELRRRRGLSRFPLPIDRKVPNLQGTPGGSGEVREAPGGSGEVRGRVEKSREEKSKSPNGDSLGRTRRKALERIPMFEAAGWKCQQCGSSENLEVDHIEPLVDGGPDEPANYQVLCRTCNRSKGSTNAVREVFEHWLKARSKSDRFTLTAARRDKIRARLKEFTVVELKRAIDAVASDPWPERYRFDDIPHLLGSREKVERWLALADGGPAPVVGRKRTGWRWVRGSGGGTYVRDPLGTDPLPAGYVTGGV